LEVVHRSATLFIEKGILPVIDWVEWGSAVDDLVRRRSQSQHLVECAGREVLAESFTKASAPRWPLFPMAA
jgi:hypothetical protein